MAYLLYEPGPSATRPRLRLTKEGSAFLSNYAHTITSYPQRAEKEAILASLRAIPGNESFTLEKLNSWFARHRNPSSPPPLVNEEAILFPKLTPTHLQQLRVLYKKRTDPSEGIVAFWANRISADKQEVAAWVEYQQEKTKKHGRVSPTPGSPDIPLQQLLGDPGRSESVSPTLSGFPRPHLPTPAKSSSPSTSPQMRMPSFPPIAVKVEEPRQCLSPVSSLSPSVPLPTFPLHQDSHDALQDLPPFSRLTKPPTASVALPRTSSRAEDRRSAMTLAAIIRDSLRPDAIPNEQPPRTVDEFTAKFKMIEKMMDALVNECQSGQFPQLGWDSSFNNVAS